MEQLPGKTVIFGGGVYRARREQTFWIPLTICCGVTVSHDRHVKCYVKTEVMGIVGIPLGGVQNAQNHKSGHLDEDSIWTLICGGSQPLVGY